MILPIVAGAASWTFAEYVLHRWVGHSTTSKLAFAREHREHHRQRQYFAPWRSKLQLAVIVVGAMAVVVLPLAGLTAFAYIVSFVGTWLVYEVIHRDLHVRAPRTAIGRFLRRHHFRHHHVDPTTNHGVTSPFWDLLFRTRRPNVHVRIVRSRAPFWLAESPSDAPWMPDYELI